jgi:hypothetical protein
VSGRMMEAGRLGEGRLAARKQRPLWMQITFGCSVAMFVLLGSLAGVGYVLFHKGTSVMERHWKELRTTTERLQTVESTKALYRGNPGLAEIYPTEGEFLKNAETWRPKLSAIPDQPPTLTSLLVDKQTLQVHENRSDGHETVRMKYTFANGAVLEMETDQGQLTDLLLK